jgi:hypothetical protein
MKTEILEAFSSIVARKNHKPKSKHIASALETVYQLVSNFCELIEDEKYNAMMTIGRTLMQEVTIATLQALQIEVSKKNHMENQKKLLQHEDLNRLSSDINLIRTKGNEQTHEILKHQFKPFHIMGFLIVLHGIVSALCEFMLKLDESKVKTYKVAIIKTGVDDICLETFYGMPCIFDNGSGSCGRAHSTEKMVYSSYFEVGSRLCKRDVACKKNYDNRKKNSIYYSLCNGLHTNDDHINSMKNTVSNRWKLYAEGKIKFEDIHKLINNKF